MLEQIGGCPRARKWVGLGEREAGSVQASALPSMKNLTRTLWSGLGEKIPLITPLHLRPDVGELLSVFLKTNKSPGPPVTRLGFHHATGGAISNEWRLVMTGHPR